MNMPEWLLLILGGTILFGVSLRSILKLLTKVCFCLARLRGEQNTEFPLIVNMYNDPPGLLVGLSFIPFLNFVWVILIITPVMVDVFKLVYVKARLESLHNYLKHKTSGLLTIRPIEYEEVEAVQKTDLLVGSENPKSGSELLRGVN